MTKNLVSEENIIKNNTVVCGKHQNNVSRA
jgi:hypothetical protein